MLQYKYLKDQNQKSLIHYNCEKKHKDHQTIYICAHSGTALYEITCTISTFCITSEAPNSFTFTHISLSYIKSLQLLYEAYSWGCRDDSEANVMIWTGISNVHIKVMYSLRPSLRKHNGEWQSTLLMSSDIPPDTEHITRHRYRRKKWMNKWMSKNYTYFCSWFFNKFNSNNICLSIFLQTYTIDFVL